MKKFLIGDILQHFAQNKKRSAKIFANHFFY